MVMHQWSTPAWMRDCHGHAVYRRGEVEASLPVTNRRTYEARGWSYVRPSEDSTLYHALMFNTNFKIRALMTFAGNREVLRARWRR